MQLSPSSAKRKIMFSAYRHSAQAYRQVATETSITSARPIELVILLYQGAIDALTQALAAPASDLPAHHAPGSSERRTEPGGERSTTHSAASSAAIARAIRIIDEGLNASLDDSGGEITAQLRDLYLYMTQQLLQARLHNDHRPVEEVRKLLTELNLCWSEIAARPPEPVMQARGGMAGAPA
jgi:flagellar secretion chaperone FliS